MKAKSNVAQVPPAEAGPISNRIHEYSKELTSRISEMIADLIKETSEANTGLADDNEGVIHILKLKIERLKWHHLQEIKELKLNHGKRQENESLIFTSSQPLFTKQKF